MCLATNWPTRARVNEDARVGIILGEGRGGSVILFSTFTKFVTKFTLYFFILTLYDGKHLC